MAGRDPFSLKKRSAIMRAVRSHDTLPELQLRKALRSAGYRPSLSTSRIPGTPDLAFRKMRVAIFVHGCFWHRHQGCSRTTTPTVRRKFWLRKFADNRRRDRRVQRVLRGAGWKCVIVWTCKINRDIEISRTIRQLAAAGVRPVKSIKTSGC